MNFNVIEKCFAQNKASSFIETFRIKEHNGISVIVGVGMFGHIYGYDYNDKIKVLIGSKVSELNVGDSFEIGDLNKINLTISGRLFEGASFFRKSILSNLDNSILILMPYSDFINIFGNADHSISSSRKMILISNLNLINSNQYEVDAVSKEINSSSEIRVVPINYNNYIMEQLNKLKDNISFFVIVIIGFFAFMSIGIINNLLTLVDNNLTEYSIGLLYGGTINEVYMRIFFYVLFIVAPSFFIAFSLINMVKIIGSISLIIQFSSAILFRIMLW